MSARTVLASARDELMAPPALVLAGAVSTIAAVVALSSARETVVAVAVLIAGIVVGERLVLRWPPAGELPLSYAVFLVAARGLGFRDAVITVVAAELLTLAGDAHVDGARWRVGRGIAVGVATVFAFHATFAVLGQRELLIVLLAALLVAAAVGAAIDGSVRRAEHAVLQTFWPERALYSWAAVVGTGVVMAVAIRGVDGAGALGTRGAVLLGLPLLAVWWSFQQADASTRLLRQTVDSLAMVPVLAGAVELGTSARDAELARHLGAQVGLTPDEQYTVAVAARLRHLGAVTFDHAADVLGGAATTTRTHRSERATAKILRDTPFTDAAPVLQRAAAPMHGHDDGRVELEATVLRTACEYHTACASGRGSAGALGSLRARHADRRSRWVVDALERVVACGDLG